MAYYASVGDWDLFVIAYYVSETWGASILQNGVGCWSGDRKNFSELNRPDAFQCFYSHGLDDPIQTIYAVSCRPL